LNVVLFPGQTLPLHIFEPRYRIMIQRCIEHAEPFGVVLAHNEEPDEPCDIGTSARVTEVKRLPDGRLNILTVGIERFRLHSFRVSEDEYLVGDVTSFPIDEATPPSRELTSNVVKRLSRYLQLLAQSNGMRFRFDQMPTDPTEVAVFAAIALRLPLEMKQELLSQETVTEMLTMESDLLFEEVKLMSITAAAIRPPEDDHIFSRN
jgi:Lon protease-like protein